MECKFENCGYYTDGECNICGMGISGEDTFCRLCKDNPKCYYKQLKWIQQEYVNLSKSFAHLQSSYQENQEYGLQLEAENEEFRNAHNAILEQCKKEQTENERLKEEIKELEDFIKSDGEIDHINHEYTYKLRTCLQEIKAIAEDAYENESEYQATGVYNEIIQRITKAESEG